MIKENKSLRNKEILWTQFYVKIWSKTVEVRKIFMNILEEVIKFIGKNRCVKRALLWKILEITIDIHYQKERTLTEWAGLRTNSNYRERWRICHGTCKDRWMKVADLRKHYFLEGKRWVCVSDNSSQWWNHHSHPHFIGQNQSCGLSFQGKYRSIKGTNDHCCLPPWWLNSDHSPSYMQNTLSSLWR